MDNAPPAPPPDRPEAEGRPVLPSTSGEVALPGAPPLAPGVPGYGTGEEPREPTLRRLVRSRGFIPTVVVVGLLLLVLLGSRLAGRPPVVDTLTPAAAKPGEVLIITGRYFGQERGEVRISGISPTTSDYSEWTDTRISVAIPEEATSGLLYVITRNGRSGGLLFINRDEIPVVASGPAKAGEPWIAAISPEAARVGDAITISGMNFGLYRGASQVLFAWTGGTGASNAAATDPAQLAPARDADLDYIFWSDREITLRVPDGAASGNVLVTSDKGRSNSKYFELLGGAGLRVYSRPRTYALQYGMSVRNVGAMGENSLYLWLPRPLALPEQRRVQLVSQSPDPLVGNYNDASLFLLANLVKGSQLQIYLAFMVERYEVQTLVAAEKVPPMGEAPAELVKRFTAPDPLVPSAATEIRKAATSAVGSEKNPYLRARRIYTWLLAQLAHDPSARGGDALGTLQRKRGDAFSYSSLFCAFARAAGIPARMVAGVIMGNPGEPTYRHFWDEFYVPSVGWVPVDPLLGDEALVAGLPPEPEADRAAFYFGSLDDRHLTFSKGLEQIGAMNPAGRTVWRRDLPWLLTLHEEAVGGLTAYSAAFDDVQVTGMY